MSRDSRARKIACPNSAAAYLRMSTDMQAYSTSNQMSAIQDYATAHGLKIDVVYEDAAKSGLALSSRPALRRLLTDVATSRISYSKILVYDVSRWGRFQDSDEGAYYEFLCKAHGVEVHYCAEGFQNEGGVSSALMKAIKRIMAGEYSRELSAKVWAGHCRMFSLGYRQGAPCPIGVRRVLVDEEGGWKADLKAGDRKFLHNDRVVLVPGPPAEQALVRQVFDMLVVDGLSETAITATLNASGSRNVHGRMWTTNTVHYLLTNPIYVGLATYNRTSQKLAGVRVRNLKDVALTRPGTLEEIVDPGVFLKAQELIGRRPRPYRTTDVVSSLRDLLQRHGRLSYNIIDADADTPSASCVSRHFGGLLRAYDAVGYAPPRRYRHRFKTGPAEPVLEGEGMGDEGADAAGPDDGDAAYC